MPQGFFSEKLILQAAWTHGGRPNEVKSEKSDVDPKAMQPLCTYGRDEVYIMNKLWLNGISSLILYGVGDGMIPWCALQNRIPIMCLYDKDLHKKTIEAFLLEKIIEKMENAKPGDSRWYRTSAQLGCREDDASGGTPVPKAKAKAPAKAKAVAAAKAPKRKRPTKDSDSGKNSDSEKSSASTQSKKSKTGASKKNIVD